MEKPDVVLVHVGTNNTKEMASNEIVDQLLSLKHKLEKCLPKTEVVLSSLIQRNDDGKADLSVRKVNEHLKQLKINLLDNSNINHKYLGKKGVHLSKAGKAKFSRNIMKRLNTA